MDVDFPWTKERFWKRTGRYGRVSWHWLALCFPRCHVCHFIDVFRVTNDRSFRQNVYVTRRNGFWQQGLEGKKNKNIVHRRKRAAGKNWPSLRRRWEEWRARKKRGKSWKGYLWRRNRKETRMRKEKHGGASIPVQCVLRDSIVR